MTVEKNERITRLEKNGYIYKKINDNWYLCRLYSNKIKHPILYHFIFLTKIVDK